MGLLIASPIFAEASKHHGGLRLIACGLGIWALAAAGCGLSIGAALTYRHERDYFGRFPAHCGGVPCCPLTIDPICIMPTRCLHAAVCSLCAGFWTLLISRMLVGVGEASFVALAAPFIGGLCILSMRHVTVMCSAVQAYCMHTVCIIPHQV